VDAGLDSWELGREATRSGGSKSEWMLDRQWEQAVGRDGEWWVSCGRRGDRG